VYIECEEELVEKCETECETTGGAIFCDGQFLNVTDINECADELSAEVDIHVDIELDAEIDIDSEGDIKEEIDDICSVTAVGAGVSGPGGGAGLLASAGVLLALRRRTRRRV
jgi:hypothetical protein